MKCINNELRLNLAISPTAYLSRIPANMKQPFPTDKGQPLPYYAGPRQRSKARGL